MGLNVDGLSLNVSHLLGSYISSRHFENRSVKKYGIWGSFKP